MHHALWLLMRLQLWGWLRFLGRSLHTVKGVAFALLGALVVIPWLFAIVVPPPADSRVEPETLLRYGPVGLLALTVLSALFAFTAQRAISFSPAEVNLLFPGPFSRRQLLAYKLAVSLGIGLLAITSVALPLRYHAPNLGAAYVGLALALMFLQLFVTALALLASTVGASVYNRSRKVLLLGLILALAAAGFWAGKEALLLGPREVLEQVQESTAWRLMLTPFSWFVQAFLAERIWPDLMLYAGLSLCVNVFLLVVIFALDAQYLEAAMASSERTYAQLERLRTGGMAAVGVAGSGKTRLSLPSLPWWGGIGPNLWRQLLAAQRGFMPLVILLIFYAITLAPILFTADSPKHDLGRALILAGTLAGVTIFLTTMIAYDFRADIDRIEVLKMLPIAPGRLVLGQLAAPVLLVSTLQLVVLTVAQAILGALDVRFLLAMAAIAYPFNFLVFGVENLLFLWFPTRLAPSTPGDFQLMGRHILLMILKTFGIAIALTPAVLMAVMASVAAESLGERGMELASLAGGWLGLVGVAAVLVRLIALAFGRFDVARDTPA